jgi:hypothetical protein
MSENNSQVETAVTPEQSAPPAETTAPEVTNVTPPQEQAPHPDLNSVQTRKAIEYFKGNPEVLRHINEQVSETLPDFNPSPDKFVTVREFALHNAIAQHQLSEADAALLANVETDAIPAFAARLAPAPASEGGNNVKPTQADAAPAKATLPTPPDSGKAPPSELGASNLLGDAFAQFKDSYRSKGT